jgi:mono/diheme cytochrome c family protein
MLFALSTSHEIGLAVAGALFITFALLSSFVFPHFNPDFPTKKGLRWYLPLCVVFFLAMMTSVFVFGKEPKKSEAAGTTTEATTTTGGSGIPAKYANGDPTAGQAVFTSAACASCHTFKPAGSTGTVGPNLDELAADAEKAGQSVGEFTVSAIISPPPKYVPPGYPTNAMPPNFGTTLTTQQIADLVAFLDAPSGS